MNERQILRKVERTIETHGMLRMQDRVLVGLSGGPDSVALLHMLIRLAPKYDLTIGAAHLDHGLRGDAAEADARFVATLCRNLQLPLFIQKKDAAAYGKAHKLSLEMAGRRLRYDFYHQIARQGGYRKIALGHQGDDSVELVLMNLLRGSGPLGMAGIPPMRDAHIIRPLIDLRRPEILFFLTVHRLAYVSDQSNSDTRFLRNRIRHQLLPYLTEEYNPNLCEALLRLASIARSEEDWIEEQVLKTFAELSHETGHHIELRIDSLIALHPALQRRVVRRAIRQLQGDLKRISYGHVDAVCRLANQGAVDGSMNLPRGLTVRRRRDRLLIVKNAPSRHLMPKAAPPADPLYTYFIENPDAPPQALLIEETGQRLTWRSIPAVELKSGIPPGKRIACFDRDKLVYPLAVRSVRPGDRFRPLGLVGTQKLKKFFINNKIPRSERKRIPLVLSRDEIIWVAGQRMGQAAKITDETRNILKFELFLA